jgi:hypothetical protein
MKRAKFERVKLVLTEWFWQNGLFSYKWQYNCKTKSRKHYKEITF